MIDTTGHDEDCGLDESDCKEKVRIEKRIEYFEKEKARCANNPGGEDCPDYVGLALLTAAVVGVPELVGPGLNLLEVGAAKATLSCISSPICNALVFGVGKSVSTPEGQALQDMSPQSIAAREIVENGVPLYKLGTLGPSKGIESQYWSLENPLTVANYAQQYGIPANNLAGTNQFLLIGELREGANFITRPAPAFGTNLGRAMEVVVEEFGVKITGFLMP